MNLRNLNIIFFQKFVHISTQENHEPFIFHLIANELCKESLDILFRKELLRFIFVMRKCSTQKYDSLTKLTSNSSHYFLSPKISMGIRYILKSYPISLISFLDEILKYVIFKGFKCSSLPLSFKFFFMSSSCFLSFPFLSSHIFLVVLFLLLYLNKSFFVSLFSLFKSNFKQLLNMTIYENVIIQKLLNSIVKPGHNFFD